MRMVYNKFPLFIISFLIGFAIINIQHPLVKKHNNPQLGKIKSTSSPKASIESKKERQEYFYRMLQDPVTKKIPEGIRQKELAFAKDLQEKSVSLNKTSAALSYNWQEAGPYDVGGRTRALAIDVNNPNIIIAGSASGGIWKSTDKGASWRMKSTTSQVLSVTCIAQDTRNGHTNTWYYASGEFNGSAQDLGFTAYFSGAGIYKSTDNGETWSLLPNAKDDNFTQWSTPYDFVSDIKVNSSTGSVFIASHGFGILRSTDGGNSFALVLGGANEHIYSDIDIAENGTIVAVISSPFQGITPANQPGVYGSTNDGSNWTRITPVSFPTAHQRSEIEIAPSNPNTAYVITFTGSLISEKYDDIRFHKINISNGTSEDRSANMPVFPFQGDEMWYNTQQNYNMTLAIKPDDENFVIIGATNLFRSTNGFSTKPSNQKLDWIGGYHPDNFSYPNFHPDIHSYAFDPTNPNSMWWGHDGGLSYTSDIRATNYQTYFPWENKNNAYNVTQFFMVTIPDESGDDRIMGGAQDNGSPSFRFDGTNTSASEDVSSGDGSYAYWGNNFAYTSSQNGSVNRLDYDGFGNPSENDGWSVITPTGAENQLFINPYVVDPNNENIMIYPAGNTLWRNNQLNSLPYNQNGTSTGWTSISNAAPNGYVITALSLSTDSPSSRLYYAAVDWSQSQGTPKLYRLDNAQTGTSAADISINGLQNGMYIHNIAVNPDNGDELMVIISNYNVKGIYYSSNGGASFSEVEGNLEGNQNNPGPSIRGASILHYNGTTSYIVGTSTGVYSTTNLNGSQTVWEQEGADVIGNLIVNYITSRPSDGRVVAGSHGRGAFVSNGSSSGNAIASANVQQLDLGSRPEETGYVTFRLSNTGNAALTYNITATGQLPDLAGKNSGTIKVLNSPGPSMKESILSRRNDKRAKELKAASGDKTNKSSSGSERITLSDVLYLDDGDEFADTYVGYGGDDFYWANEFSLTGYNYQLESIDFYMTTEYATSNAIYVGVYDAEFNALAEGNLTLSLASSGDWFNVTLNNPIEIPEGNTFYLVVGTVSSNIWYPAGTDVDGIVTDKSYYLDENANLISLSTVSGFENGAFLIRAVGTATEVNQNQNPAAVANVNPLQAGVNEAINFDGSQSNDNDGQITAYLWNFGDGSTSTQATVTHSYSQAGNFTYSLLVTDNDGGTGQATGQVTILEGASRLSVDPSSGTIAAGGSQMIRITLDAVGLPNGTYSGEVNIVTNGGNITLPLNITVDPTVSVKNLKETPTEFYLSQNYPNPFNPATTIEFSIPERSIVNLKIFDIKGEEVRTVIQEEMNPGKYSINFNASGLVSGIYLYKLQANGFVKTKKLILLK